MLLSTTAVMSIQLRQNGNPTEARRDMPVQVVMSEHMSVHASLLMMRSVKLNLESTDMIKLFLI